MSAMRPSTTADLSSILEGMKEKVASYATDRKHLADTLRQVVSDAQALLADLGEAAVATVNGKKRGRPKGSGRGPGRPPSAATPVTASKRRKMSAEARAKIAAAQKKRWAAQKAAK